MLVRRVDADVAACPMKQIVLLALALFVGVAIGYSGPKLKNALMPRPSGEIIFQDTSHRDVVACPAPGPRVMVALIVGQSHSGNYAGERFVGRPNSFQLYQGRCYPARDPVLGVGGVGGSVWTLIADQLLDSGTFDSVMVVNLSRGNAKVDRWTEGDLGAVLEEGAKLPAGLRFTHVILTEGVADRVEGTPVDTFVRSYHKLVDMVMAKAPGAPVFVSMEVGYCSLADTNSFDPDHPLSKAVRRIPDPARGVFPGADMDVIVPAKDRYDGCHSSGTGARNLANEWTRILREHQATAGRPS